MKTHMIVLPLALCLVSCGGSEGVVGDADATDTSPDTAADTATDTASDTATDPDVMPDGPCIPHVVHDDACDPCDAVILLGWFWSGTSCIDLWGCRCVGEDCALGQDTEDACLAVHAGCDGALCTSTGGTWIPSAACATCDHFVCGEPPPEMCCGPGCDCGPGRSFEPGTGCVSDPTCTPEALCRATHGTWYDEDPCGPCGHYHCGEPPMLGCCSPGCDCGASRVFQEGVGCVVSDECDPTREDVCTTTGGTWYPAAPCGPCGDYICGEPSGDDCCDAGCDCGPHKVYEPGVGCVFSSTCFDRTLGQTCVGSGEFSTCRPGLACCSVSGIMLRNECLRPCCEDDPMCMEDGCPVPPP